MKIYTQAELEGMSDLELNLAVTELIHDGEIESDEVGYLRGTGKGLIDYCNNECNSFGLMAECNIVTLPTIRDSGTFFAADRLGDFISTNKNELRAVAVVYILIKQGVMNEINS